MYCNDCRSNTRKRHCRFKTKEKKRKERHHEIEESFFVLFCLFCRMKGKFSKKIQSI